MTLHLTLLELTIYGYCFLLGALLLTGSWWRVRFFSCYLGILIFYGLSYDPTYQGLWMIIEPALLAMRVGVLVEIFALITNTIPILERRWIVVLLLSLAGIALVLVSGYYSEDTALSWYRAVRLNTHLILTVISIFGRLALWVEPPRIPNWIINHAFTFTIYLTAHTTCNFIKPATSLEWYLTSILFTLTSWYCIYNWLRSGIVIQPGVKAPG